MKVVLIGHGHTAEAMKGAVEMIFGEVADFYPVAFLPKEGLQELIAKMKTVTDNFEAKDTLVIADLFAGTPYNAAATLALQHEVQDVIAGMSLPICLEIASQMNQLSVTELVTYIMKNSRDYTKALSIINQEQAAEEDF
ncbi:PTS sugar transporter subunit IIA [Lactiplantibacillus mudanjiangensis]|uniref:PTS system, mannose-specific IIB component [Lactobacillus sp. wkB8] n=1 Tax=Lactiplantibacillus mudanjiangensis TaxID=1296538 RepID=A0A660DUM3_9LACO|nr:mannose/fructose/sorbose PTS transporter subunit IIA [Lactiplantibacillus mudanjiangensis]VDG22592.1 PTS system, mannose-specific IIB component [Lactobacillus sp. wkB8] [Lactiplantibacillus mudanjiangensis]VDG26870.1 PTS system, mannose-specific IIB component [Lactobacillus sp. wkB8] [Lactiplantibacillus mudanjiangensis]